MLTNKLNNLEKNESSLIAQNKRLKDKMSNDHVLSDNILLEKELLIQSLSLKIQEKDLVIKQLKKISTTGLPKNEKIDKIESQHD